MVLIVSQDKYETSTDEVIDWLLFLGVDFKRINGIEIYKNIEINISNSQIILKLAGIDINTVKRVWFRRWLTEENIQDISLNGDSKETRELMFNTGKEWNSIINFVVDYIPESKIVNLRLEDSQVKKLNVLRLASQIGLKIPNTYIVTNLKNLDKREKFITKSAYSAPNFNFNRKQFVGYTSEIVDFDISGVFAPSMIQKKINKEFEIRSFVIENEVYSIAIFSQKDKQTQVDFRRYNNIKPNRVSTFNVPLDVKLKLVNLIKQLKLKFASVDLIKTKNEYIFLEVNPEGQFSMVSKLGNYYLESKIADYLSK